MRTGKYSSKAYNDPPTTRAFGLACLCLLRSLSTCIPRRRLMGVASPYCWNLVQEYRLPSKPTFGYFRHGLDLTALNSVVTARHQSQVSKDDALSYQRNFLINASRIMVLGHKYSESQWAHNWHSGPESPDAG